MHEHALSPQTYLPVSAWDRMQGEEDGAHFAVTVKAGIRSSGGRRVGVTLERGERESWMEGEAAGGC